MATMTGKNLLESIIKSAGVEINNLILATLSAKLQQMIDNGTYSKLAASIAMSGFSTVINDATEIGELNDAVETNAALIEAAEEDGVEDIVFPPIGYVDIDTAAFPTQTDFDASGDAYNFLDDASISNYAVIENFSADDTISFVNADVGDYAFSNEGEDVTLSYNYNDEGTMNVIMLTGVVSSDDLVYDLASFTDAVGFDAFG
jgi:hypothetical protein